MARLTLKIDGLEVEADESASILSAALVNGIYIPHLCYHPELKPSGVCRLCFVEADEAMVMSCKTSVKKGMVVRTKSPSLDKIRRTNIEILVANNHITCKGCPGSGACSLQKIMGHIRIDKKSVRRLRQPKEERPREALTEYIDYDPNKCILCEICIRTCGGIQNALYLMGRGYGTRIAFFGDPQRCESCSNECVQRCPVGALISEGKGVAKQSPSLPARIADSTRKP